MGLEDTATFDRPKVIPEDVGFMLLHPEQRCVQIEGLHCRYLIHADDVNLILMPPTKTRAVQITYHIGDVPLSLTIITDSVKKQVFWQLTGRSGTLYDVMRAVLEPKAIISK